MIKVFLSFFGFVCLFVCFGFVFFETGFLCVALAVLELTLKTRLASNSDLPDSAEIKGVSHRRPAFGVLFYSSVAFLFVCLFVLDLFFSRQGFSV